MNLLRILLLLCTLIGPYSLRAADEGDHHPHHVAKATGIAGHDSKTSVYIGAFGPGIE